MEVEMVVVEVPKVGPLDRRMHYSDRLPVTPQVTTDHNLHFLQNAWGKVQVVEYLSHTQVHQTSPYFPDGVSLFVRAAHEAFADHVPFEIRPEVIWYIIAHEMAILVKSDPSRYADLFSGDPENLKTIKVRDDSLRRGSNSDWAQTLTMFRKPLFEAMGPQALRLFLPRFTTSTEESDVATIISFMDVVSSYYAFRVDTMCHIPAFRIAGELEDWNHLILQVNLLKSAFPEMRAYFDGIFDVLENIYDTVRLGEGDPEFWRSFYKFDHESGGDSVTGWVNALFAYRLTEKEGYKLKKTFGWRERDEWITTTDFGPHVSIVPFVWNYFGKEIPMKFSAGVFGVEYEDGFLSPRLGFGVYEPK
jgi:hypothetical protein